MSLESVHLSLRRLKLTRIGKLRVLQAKIALASIIGIGAQLHFHCAIALRAVAQRESHLIAGLVLPNHVGQRLLLAQSDIIDLDNDVADL